MTVVLVGLALASAVALFGRLALRTRPGGPLDPPRPGSDDQWRAWTGPNGHPLPLNDQAQQDRAERGQTSGPQGE